jgi:crossover junction endodeoxyribonuclease RusA
VGGSQGAGGEGEEVKTSQIKLTLPYPPSANRYWRNFRGRMVKSAEARDYQELVKATNRVNMMEGDLIFCADVYRPAKRRDIDNCIKVVLDSLQGIAYANDSQVKRVDFERHDTDRKNPRVVVVIEKAA